jgi:hypothetical protein
MSEHGPFDDAHNIALVRCLVCKVEREMGMANDYYNTIFVGLQPTEHPDAPRTESTRIFNTTCPNCKTPEAEHYLLGKR